MYDFHLHSDFSIDSKSTMTKIVLAAIEKNLKSICITDHVEFDITDEKIDVHFRVEDYFKSINKVKYKYKKEIEILSGVEIGMQPHLADRYSKYIKDNPFDFVIMSIHTVQGKDIYLDGFIDNNEPSEAILLYYNDMYECVKNFDDFDSLGHIDFIDRYFNDLSLIPKFEDYYDQIKKILEILILKGKGLEINTAGLRYGLGYFHPKIQILKLYKELGGEIITIGSDSHNVEFIGYEYKAVEKTLKELGFKYIYIFKERKNILYIYNNSIRKVQKSKSP